MGSKPRGGRPKPRRGARGRRPASLCPRRETRGRPRGPARLGRRGVSAEPAAVGPRAWALGLRVARAGGQVAAEGARRPAPASWQAGHSSSAPGSLLEEPCGPAGLRFPSPLHVACPNFLLGDFLRPPPPSPLVLPERTQRPSPAGCVSFPPIQGQGQPPGGGTRCGL